MNTITFVRRGRGPEYNVIDSGGDVLGTFKFLRPSATFDHHEFVPANASRAQVHPRRQIPEEFTCFIEEYRNVYERLTQTEWCFFSIMLADLDWHYHNEFLVLFPNMPRSNVIHVHIKNLRKAFREANLPFSIETRRRGRLEEGAFRLVAHG